jgi:TusE/DsrC/DsvC family sulfur relay protein
MKQTQHQNPSTGRGNLPLQFDEDGFLINSDAWSRETARLLAKMDGLGNMTPDHWSVIMYLREKHLESGGLPVMSHICRIMHLGEHGVQRLFGSCREAWRIAGLPNPGEEAKNYM